VLRKSRVLLYRKMEQKTNIYGTESEFIRALDEFGLPLKEIAKSVKHESAHINEARALGHRADYCIIVEDDGFKPGMKLYNSEIIANKHLIRIISAPETLSPGDISQLKSLGVLA